jgi:hypothetical protein
MRLVPDSRAVRSLLNALALAVALGLGVALSSRALAQDGGEPVLEPLAAASEQTVRWSLRLSGELGVGSRDFDVPVDGVVQQTRTGLFPALGVGFALDHAASDDVSLGLLVRYQTSVAHGIVERHTAGSDHPLNVRSHRLELGVVPSVRLDGEGRWALAATAGYSVRSFRPEAHHLITPAYGLGGPHLRVELKLAPFGELIRLRVGPEVHWIVQVGDDLLARGIADRGLGLGGEAALELAVGGRWTVHVAYVEMRSWADSSQSRSFVDVARFLTAGLAGTL